LLLHFLSLSDPPLLPPLDEPPVWS